MKSCSGKKRRSECPVTFALDSVGDKWSLLIVRDMMFLGKQTYTGFLESGEGIATNILADRLKSLEAEGIIDKQQDPENKRRLLYKLTDKGFDLAPVLLEMMRWSARYDKDTGIPDDLLQRIEKDPQGLIKAIRAGMSI